jgi:hypothetical protein
VRLIDADFKSTPFRVTDDWMSLALMKNEAEAERN